LSTPCGLRVDDRCRRTGFTSFLLAHCNVKRVVDAFHSAIPVPELEIVVHRALRRQVFGQRLPLASGPEHVENPVQDFAHVDRAFASTVSPRRDHRSDNRPFVVSQIAWITQAPAVRGAAMIGCPHGALLRESGAQQGITSDSSDSRTSRIGSESPSEKFRFMTRCLQRAA